MKKAFAVGAAMILIVFVSPSDALILRSNDFSTNPSWAAFNNTTSPNNFGYSTGTTNATGVLANAGEVGGTTGRNSFDSYYADTNLTETQTLDHELFGSGSFTIKNPNAWDHGILIGHFNTADTGDIAGMLISEPSGAFTQSRVRAAIYRDFAGNTIAATPNVNVSRDVPHSFSYFWDPDGGVTGRGLLSMTIDNVTLTSEDAGGAFVLAERNGSTPMLGFTGWGMSLDGLNNQAGLVDVFFDNAVYSIPEPGAVLMMLGGVILLWRRQESR